MRRLLTSATLRRRVDDLARQLDNAYARSGDLLLLGVLRGAVYFLADLSRAMRTPHRLDFVEYTSYTGITRGNGSLAKRWSDPLTGSDVVLVDEVCDSGETLALLRDAVIEASPRSVAVCVLLDKQRPKALQPDFVGFEVGPEFLVGYGLDFNQRYRHLPYVAVLRTED